MRTVSGGGGGAMGRIADEEDGGGFVDVTGMERAHRRRVIGFFAGGFAIAAALLVALQFTDLRGAGDQSSKHGDSLVPPNDSSGGDSSVGDLWSTDSDGHEEPNKEEGDTSGDGEEKETNPETGTGEQEEYEEDEEYFDKKQEEDEEEEERDSENKEVADKPDKKENAQSEQNPDDLGTGGPEDYAILTSKMPECAKKKGKAKAIFMYMLAHSGTTAMITGLATHSQLGDFTGFLDMEPLWSCHGDFPCEAEKTKAIYANATDHGKVGLFKYNGRTMSDDPDGWKELFEEVDPHFIFMYRTNVFKRSVGRYPYNFLGYEAHFGGLQEGEESRCDTGDLCTFTVEPEKVFCEMRRGILQANSIRSYAESLQKDPNCYLTVTYEDYLDHYNETMFMVEDFLGIDRELIDPGREKSTSDNMCDVIENYGDLCAAFNDCPLWQDMMNDEENNCLCENFEYESLGGPDVNRFCHMNRLASEKTNFCIAGHSEYNYVWKPGMEQDAHAI